VKIAIVSDIHSNMDALDAVHAAVERLGADSIYFIGDAVGYGPDPNPCTKWVMDNAEVAVAGNHDAAAVGLADSESFNSYAREAILWNARQLEPETSGFLSSLPLVEERDGITLVHASPKLPDVWDYIFTLWDAEVNFSHFDGPICFVGHSHQPVMVSMDVNGAVSVVPGDSLTIEDGFRYLINVGSVGQPRDGNPAACFGLLDRDAGVFSIQRVEYDISAIQKKMREAGLPQPLADRLSEGR